jgi:hypothetical protein
MKDKVRVPVGKISVYFVDKETGKKTPVFLNHQNLLTDSGRDWMHSKLYGSGTGTAKWIALSTNTAVASSSDTILLDEITGSGLGRSEATVSHTPGSSDTTLTIEFESTASIDGIKKVGLFTALSPFPDSTLVHLATFPIDVNVANGTLINLEWVISLT